ncbi:MAG: adenylate class-3/4/guanylyl cyclase, partial [Hyphomicrobiales bacterium]|nr:adenylate class-3/4/guanylyl cyclase [Hyphomicrobiales bacterium]
HNGRIVKLMGDGMLVEFASAVDAVCAASETQQALATHNASLSPEKRIEFRIGINLGDVVIDGDDIHGDGVNIAARLEGLADPGGICVSEAVYEQVRHRIELKFEDIGEQDVKNIDRPVRAWRWLPGATIAATDSSSHEKPLQVVDKPSIAVLPFTNMSSDPEQDYFADGITEDIITELSRFNSLSVIARNSSFHYKGQSPKIQDVGRELGVQYVIEGSVRKSGNRVRITAQLVESQAGKHIWAQRYDRELNDIFELQDEVTKVIVGIIPGRLDVAETQRSARKPPEEMTAYDHYLRGLHKFHLGQTLGFGAGHKALHEAKDLFREATEMAPDFAGAHTYLARTGFNQFLYLAAGKDALQDALESVRTAMMLDPNDNSAPVVLGLVLIFLGREVEGIPELEQSLALNKNNAELLYWSGFALTFVGRPGTGKTHIEEAIRLDPFNSHYYLGLGFALYLCGQFEDAVEAFRKIVRDGWIYPHVWMAAAYGQLGLSAEAVSCAEQFFLNVSKQFRDRGEPVPESIIEICEQAWRDYYPRSDWLESLRDGLQKAGLS